MKYITIIILILTLNTFHVFSASISEVNQNAIAPESGSRSTSDLVTAREQEEQATGMKKLEIGVNTNFGISMNSATMTSEGTRYAMLSGGLSCRALLHFTLLSGMMFEAGFHYQAAREETEEGYFTKFQLFSGFLSVAYLMTYKDFSFFFGPYMEFLIYGKNENSSYEYDKHSMFVFPNLGFSFGFGFTPVRKKTYNFYVGLNFKYQLLTFTRISTAGSQMLAILLDITFYFK